MFASIAGTSPAGAKLPRPSIALDTDETQPVDAVGAPAPEDPSHFSMEMEVGEVEDEVEDEQEDEVEDGSGIPASQEAHPDPCKDAQKAWCYPQELVICECTTGF